MLQLRENLILAEEDRQNGNEGHSIDDVTSMMGKIDYILDCRQDYSWLLNS